MHFMQGYCFLLNLLVRLYYTIKLIACTINVLKLHVLSLTEALMFLKLFYVCRKWPKWNHNRSTWYYKWVQLFRLNYILPFYSLR